MSRDFHMYIKYTTNFSKFAIIQFDVTDTQLLLRDLQYVQFYNYERINLKNGLTSFEIRSKIA